MRYFQLPVVPHLLFGLAILVCLGIYWEGLYGPLLLDDTSNLGNILDPNFSPNDILPSLFSPSGIFKRPVAMASFIINGLLKHDLFYWKLANLIIHLCCGVLLYFFTIRLFRFANMENKLLAMIVAAAWILHPLQVSTVLYTVQRMTELSALFVFAALLTYSIARERQRNGLTSWPLQLVTWLIIFPLGLFSKENALLLPVFILLLEIFVISKEQFDNRRLLKITIAASIIGVVIIAMLEDWILRGYITRDFTLVERLYTEGRVLIAYLGMLLIPVQKRMGFVHDDFTISHSLLEPWTTLPSILVIFSLITIAIFLRKKQPLISFGILFFFIGHVMESTLLALEIMFEHRNYLPSFGIILAASIAISKIIKNKVILTSFSIAIFALIIFATSVRTDTWASTVGLYYYMEMVHPNSERLAAIKATQYESAGQFSLAKKRLANFPGIGAELHRLNIDCSENKSLSIHQLDINVNQSRVADNYAILQLTDLANRGLDDVCDFSPHSFLNLLGNISSHPTITAANRQIVLMYKAHYLWKTNKQEDALETLNKTFIINKDNPTPLFLACEWMLDTNRLKEAEKTCNTALNIARSAPFNKYDDLADNARNRLNPTSGNRVK